MKANAPRRRRTRSAGTPRALVLDAPGPKPETDGLPCKHVPEPVTLELWRSDLRVLDELAARHGRSRSEIMRAALHTWRRLLEGSA